VGVEERLSAAVTVFSMANPHRFSAAPGLRTGWRLCIVGVIVFALFALFTWVLAILHPMPGPYLPHYGQYRSPFSEAISFSFWAFAVFICAVYGLLWVALGARKARELTNRSFGWLIGRDWRGE
jgi:hypothetical protein